MMKYYVHGFAWYRDKNTDGTFGYKQFEGFELFVEAHDEKQAKELAIELFDNQCKRYKNKEYFKPSVADIDEISEAIDKPFALVVACSNCILERYDTAEEAVKHATQNNIVVNLNRQENKKYL